VFSAHLDHLGTRESDEEDTVYNGFYDNAVGVAIMLESARALSKLTTAPRRSVVFLATTGEESGLLGSDYFVNNPAVPDTSIVANVNVDLPMFLFPMNTITTWGAERTTFEAAAAAEVSLEGFEALPYPYPGELGDINRSDSYPFAKQGIPFIWMMEGVGSSDAAVDGLAKINAFYDDHYHQVSDDLSRPVHWDTAVRFARACARVTHRIAMDDDAPVWKEGDFIGEKFGKKTVTAVELVPGFVTPPDDVKLSAYWYWINDNISEEGVKKDLEFMSEIGIGRAFIGNIGDLNMPPAGDVKIFSDDWWNITRAAITKASELNMEMPTL